MIIAGIGSRSTPLHIQDLFTKFGEEAYRRGWYLRSGHAPGADVAFEKGAGTNSITYLPWYGFNSEVPIYGSYLVPDYPNSQAMEILKRFEPNILSRRPGVQKLKHRNVYQIYGSKFDQLSNLVICYTPGGLLTGGTALAIRMANELNIPVINLGQKELTLEQLLNKTIALGGI